MPFPRAHFYILALLVTTFVAFMPSYFSILPNAPLVHHLHGITATLWIVLLATQNWTIHHRYRKAHVWSGIASMALVPLFTVGGMLVTQHTVQSGSPFAEIIGLRLAFADVVASIGFVVLYALALRYRRRVDWHARLMLSTVFLLIGPVISRLLANYVPGFLVRGVEELPNFEASVDVSFIFAASFCLVLIFRDRLTGKSVVPFGIGLAATLAMFASYKLLGRTDAWMATTEALAGMSPWLIAAGSLIVSLAATWWGWAYPAPRQPGRKAPAIAAPAE